MYTRMKPHYHVGVYVCADTMYNTCLETSVKVLRTYISGRPIFVCFLKPHLKNALTAGLISGYI